MPRRRSRRRYRRRRNKKSNAIVMGGDKEVIKTGKAKYKSIVYRGIGIPSTYFTKLKYTVQYNAGSVGSPFIEYLFRMNSVFDPEFALGGGQPMYYDQITAMYRSYCVFGSGINLTFTQKTNTTEAAFIKCGVYPIETSNSASGVSEAIERDNCVYAQLGPNTGDQGIVNMNAFAKPYAVLGRGKFEKEDDTMCALVSSNPVQQCLWHVFLGTNDGLTSVNAYIEITLTYYVKFFDRIDVERST